ncbi:mastermind-like domain-containing protein 1 [Bombina bombina]|uniref:mastermind-like domain-containing protein 1 n=1 Tax=Bombina bombina TaxID=8345 RepID=UPI00235AC2DD|nr:mastermind-like domain-containing protein 1 [Bombina bombina]
MLLVSQRIEGPRMEPYMTLQGSIKRKLEDDSSPVSSGMNDLIFPSDNKRLCLDDVTLSMGQTQSTSSNISCTELQNSPFSTNHSSSSLGVSGHPGLLENNHMNGRGMASPFSVSQNTEMGQKGSYEEKAGNLHSVDQELQDLLEELTKMPDPSPNDLDIEKILGSKVEEPIVISHSQPTLSTTPKLSPQTASHMDNHISNKDFSTGCNPASAGSPQVRPSSAGTNYSVPPASKPVQSPIPSTQNKSQTQSMLPVSMTNMPGANWHAQQLKQLAASKQGTSTKQQVQPTNWPTISPTGLSPPYRSGSSPQQSFSPQNVMVSGIAPSSLQGNNIQGSQNPLISSMSSTSNQTSRPSPPYVSEKISSPALNQQPFSPQNSLLPNMTTNNLPANTIKSPQSNMVSSMTSSSAGPSPPYQPEKLSSPSLIQQPFSPQNSLISGITPSSSQSSMQSSLFKPMSTSQPKNINMIMQQPSNGLQTGIVNETPVVHDQFNFNNTKPLSHFAPDSASQKMNLSPSPGSLIHYLQQQQQQQQQQNPAVQQPQQVSNSQFLQQQLRQLMQPSRIQRQMQPSNLPAQNRQDPNVGMIPRLQEPGSITNSGSVPAPPTANGYIRNAILKEQIMRRQMMQVKPRQNMMGVPSEQRNSFVAQQMSQFQALPQTVRSGCVQPMATPQQNHRMITSAQGLIQNSMGSGITPPTMSQNSGAMVMMPHNNGKQQGIFPPSSDFNIPIRQSQNPLSMTSGCQTVHTQPTVRPGMTLSGYASSSLTNHSATQQHLRQSNISRIPNVYANSSSQMWTQAGVSRISSQNQMDPGMQQFPNNPLFSKQNVRPNMSNQFPHQAVVPPNQIAPGVQIRQMQKLGLAQGNQAVSSINSSTMGNSISRGQLAAINAMKSLPQGVNTFNQLNPGQLGPPSYVPSSLQAQENFERISSGAELHQYDFGTAQNSSILSANCNEADFIDCLMKGGSTCSTDEDWLNNLTMLDDILGQHTQNPGPV